MEINMSFDNKNYPNRKDKRKPYYKSGKHDRSCRPNGGCAWCQGNRLHKNDKQDAKYQQYLDELWGR